MPGPEFFQTGMGRTFFEGTLPRLVTALERIADSMTRTEEETGPAPRKRKRRVSVRARTDEAGMAGDQGGRAGEAPRVLLGRGEDVWRMLRGRAPAEQEAFFVIAIDIRNGMIGEPEMVALGHVHGVQVCPREVFREAVRKAAAAIVIAHNHPSGDPTPSTEDIELTKRLRSAGDLIGIPVIDHVVFTPDKYRSIAEWMGSEF